MIAIGGQRSRTMAANSQSVDAARHIDVGKHQTDVEATPQNANGLARTIRFQGLEFPASSTISTACKRNSASSSTTSITSLT